MSSKNIYLKNGRLRCKKFWDIKVNPISGFPPERLIRYRHKPKEYGYQR